MIQEDVSDLTSAANNLEISDAGNIHASEILNIDNEDEALKKYKESLMGGTFDSLNIKKGEKAKLDILKLTVTCDEDNIKNTYNFNDLKNTPIRIKEGIEFNIILDVLV